MYKNSLKKIPYLSLCCILSGCISTKTSEMNRARGIEHTQEQRITHQGQTLAEILGVFIGTGLGFNPILAITVTDGSTINFIDKKFRKIEEYKAEENRLKEELFGLEQQLNKLKNEYQLLQKALKNLQNLKEEKREELQKLNQKYRTKISKYGNKLNNVENYIRSSKKIVRKEPLLLKIEEYRNDLNSL